MVRSKVAVLNMGMKSIRCIIFDEDGRKLSGASRPLTSAINDSRVEQNPAEWWQKGIEVMRRAVYEAGIKELEYITVTASASCLVCVDQSGEAVGNSIMVSDKRAVREAAEIAVMPEFKEAERLTGLPMSASLMLPKILWVKRHDAEAFDKTCYFLTPNDYLIHKLSGIFKTDYLNALKYHYDEKNGKYPDRLLKALGISLHSLPEAADTGETAGSLLPEVKEKIGLKGDTEVVISSYDAICSFIGSGVSEAGQASDVSGTVTVFRAVGSSDMAGSREVYITPFRQGGFSIIGGSNNLGGGLIEWVKQCYYLKEEYPYEVMEKEASESEIGARGIIFLPYLLGERVPVWDDYARGVFFGLEREHTRKDMTRAVFESAGFIDRDIAESVACAGSSVAGVRLSGGLARINLISQIKADILGKEVSVLSEFETTASGAAMIVLHGRHVFKTLKDAADRFVSIRMIIKPDMDNHKKYDLLYRLYKESYAANKELFIKRMQVMGQIRRDRETQIENL